MLICSHVEGKELLIMRSIKVKAKMKISTLKFFKEKA